ncbi:MAG: hypothetical protein ABR968_11870, partial [Bacteroidales bacterium]
PLPLEIIKGSEYSNIVIILDSTDVVYLYQTEIIKKEIFDKANNKGKSNNRYFIDFNSDSATFIGLRPEHLVKFDSKSFIHFIEDNNDVFNLDTNANYVQVLFIASNKDTVKNPALYDIVKLITKKSDDKRTKIHYMVRRTTKEEDNVIYCKKRKLKYDPTMFKSPANLINRKYDSTIKRIGVHLTPRLTYKIDTLKFSGNIE